MIDWKKDTERDWCKLKGPGLKPNRLPMIETFEASQDINVSQSDRDVFARGGLAVVSIRGKLGHN